MPPAGATLCCPPSPTPASTEGPCATASAPQTDRCRRCRAWWGACRAAAAAAAAARLPPLVFVDTGDRVAAHSVSNAATRSSYNVGEVRAVDVCGERGWG